MTEADWLTSTNPQAMLEFIRGTWCAARGNANAANRKLRLFACAACRQALSWSGNLAGDSLRLCDLSDRYADSEITYPELEAFVPTHPDCSWPLRYDKNVHTTVLNIINAKPFLKPQAALLRDIFGNPFDHRFKVRWGQVHEHAQGAAPRVPSWLTWHDGIIPRLAQAAYDERRRQCERCQGEKRIARMRPGAEVGSGYGQVMVWEDCPDCHGTGGISDGTLDAWRLVVLADALEEAGCIDEAILRHLRDPRPHVCGCHVLDLLLGKE